MSNIPADQQPAFPKMTYREGPYDSSVDCYDCDEADPYIDWQRQEIERLREWLVQINTISTTLNNAQRWAGTALRGEKCGSQQVTRGEDRGT